MILVKLRSLGGLIPIEVEDRVVHEEVLVYADVLLARLLLRLTPVGRLLGVRRSLEIHEGLRYRLLLALSLKLLLNSVCDL